MKIYVCGGSSEMDLVAERMRQLREMGHEITFDWVSAIRSRGGDANPRDASHEDREDWTADDLVGIETARLVWVILPEQPSFGCAFEAGYALGIGQRVLMSGDWRASVFSCQADARFDEHDRVIDWIKLYTTPGSWDREMSALEAK